MKIKVTFLSPRKKSQVVSHFAALMVEEGGEEGEERRRKESREERKEFWTLHVGEEKLERWLPAGAKVVREELQEQLEPRLKLPAEAVMFSLVCSGTVTRAGRETRTGCGLGLDDVTQRLSRSEGAVMEVEESRFSLGVTRRHRTKNGSIRGEAPERFPLLLSDLSACVRGCIFPGGFV